MNIFKLAKAGTLGQPKLAPAVETKILRPESKDDEQTLKTAMRMGEAENVVIQKVMETPAPAELREATAEDSELSTLVDENFPFDESQLAAIDGIVNSPEGHACLTGAAGTGKTTVTKAIVERLKKQLHQVDIANYHGSNEKDELGNPIPKKKKFVPAIVMCGFTGRSTQQTKRNFPRDWHQNIMTIHRMLGYKPEYVEGLDENGNLCKKRVFLPTYTENYRLPWDIIIIDEAGMVSVDLWENIRKAAKPGCRIIMIGDINQLPPVHGRSIFGFALSKWPRFELTHIHRQEGENNSIVDNAWRVLNGQRPISDKPESDWKFMMTKIDSSATTANRQVRKFLQILRERKVYDPIRDTVITPTNGESETSKGFQLGQVPLNRDLAIQFNGNEGRYVIDAGREKRRFAVGDKVMATKNDHEAGITNGMQGIITSITENGSYVGDRNMWGLISQVNAYMASHDLDDDGDDDEVNLEDLMNQVLDQEEKDKKAEEEGRGPASHIVTVRFGDGEEAFEIPFATLSEVCSLQTAYAVTCHKMQGGEAPTILVIVHTVHGRMLNREWLYTAITRASQRCILLYTDQGLGSALTKQSIRGRNLEEKIQLFIKLSTEGILGAAVKVNLNVGTGA